MSNFSPRQQPFNYGLAPIEEQGPRYVAIVLTFAGAGSISDDLTLENENGMINNVQCVYIDNSVNPLPVTLTMGDSGQIITAPAATQGFFPCLAHQQVAYTVTTGGATTIRLFFINVPIEPAMWSSNTAASAITVATTPTTTQGNGPTAFIPIGAYNMVSAQNSTASAMTPAIPAPGVGLTNYLTGFSVSGNGATAASVIAVTLTGLGKASNTLTFYVSVPVIGSGAVTNFTWTATTPIQRTSSNASLGLNVPSMGAGNTLCACELHGFAV